MYKLYPLGPLPFSVVSILPAFSPYQGQAEPGYTQSPLLFNGLWLCTVCFSEYLQSIDSESCTLMVYIKGFVFGLLCCLFVSLSPSISQSLLSPSCRILPILGPGYTIMLVSAFQIRIGSGFNQVRGSGSGKMTYINIKKLRIFMFWSAGCSLLRAEGFFRSMDILCEGLVIKKIAILKNDFFPL